MVLPHLREVGPSLLTTEITARSQNPETQPIFPGSRESLEKKARSLRRVEYPMFTADDLMQENVEDRTEETRHPTDDLDPLLEDGPQLTPIDVDPLPESVVDHPHPSATLPHVR